MCQVCVCVCGGGGGGGVLVLLLLSLLLLCVFEVRADTVVSCNGMNKVFCIQISLMWSRLINEQRPCPALAWRSPTCYIKVVPSQLSGGRG